MAFGHIVVRPWREEDIEPLRALRNDPALQELLMARPKQDSAERVRQWLVERSTAGDGHFFVVADGATDAAIGYIQVVAVDARDGVGELGICLSPSVHGSGVARAALNGSAARLRAAGLRKLVLRVVCSNARAIAFYRKSGFREVGVLREHHRVGDAWLDVLLMEKFIDR